MRKKIISICALFTVAVVVMIFCAYRAFYGSAVAERFTVTIDGSQSYNEQVEEIKANISHNIAFALYARRINITRGIEGGRYTFDNGMSVIEVARRLKFGNDGAVRLTINNARTPEILAGKIAAQIDADSVAVVEALRSKELLAELGYESGEALMSIFLPNTYEVYANITPEALIKRMKRESEKFWAQSKRQQQLARLGLTSYEVMTLASIVHEETSYSAEMSRVAGVYVNRLRKGMPLQADPTVKYAVGDPGLKRILYKHLEVESPYNTYQHVGLPPTPICMPDMEVINAVLDYEEHKYYYFCACPEMDGKHNFARTHSEHERNAQAYHRALSKMKIR